MGQPTTCIIGAGCSGFTTAKALQDAGIEFDCFEASDNIGGNWYYKNPNGMSACYQSLHIDTSRTKAEFREFPMPESWPDFPHHSQIFEYFNHYVDHFDLRRKITFNTRVEKVKRQADGRWQVTTNRGHSRSYDYLFVANGHHWSASTPKYPGHFNGQQIHAHNYRTPTEPVDMQNKRVLVVGFGNSCMDIASELSQRHVSAKLCVSARRGGYVMPKYLFGKPADKSLLPGWVPPRVSRRLIKYLYNIAVGDITKLGVQQPDHLPLEAHPSVSGEFVTRLGSGDIQMRMGIDRFDGDDVIFTDGRREAFDVIIYATGYDIQFPFLEQLDLPLKENHIPLFKRMIRPELPNLLFMGLAQPLPALINLAELQMKLVVPLIQGGYQLPDRKEMEAAISADEQEHIGHFYRSRRHTMQIDGARYERDLLKEIKRGNKRARASSRKGIDVAAANLARV